MSRGRAAAWPVFLAVAIAGGCAKGPAAPYQILGTIAASGPLTAEQIAPLRASRRVYDVSNGAGDEVVFVCEGTDRFGAVVAEHEGQRRSEFRRLDDEGNVVTPVLIDRGDAAITSFDPPLVAAWRSLEPGEQRRQQVAMRVVDLNDPTREKESGTATKTITYGGDYRIRVRGRVYEVRRIDVVFKADLKMAEAETTTTLWFAPESGPVVIERVEIVKVFGIRIRNRRQTLVLIPGAETDRGDPG